jgi:hypothetical protein
MQFDNEIWLSSVFSPSVSIILLLKKHFFPVSIIRIYSTSLRLPTLTKAIP